MKKLYKNLVIIISLVFANTTFANTFTIEVIGKQVREETIYFSSGRKFVSFKHEGGFKSSLSRYGSYFCEGTILFSDKNLLSTMNLVCEFSDQESNSFWTVGKRQQGSEEDRAVGKFNIVEGDGFWKKYVNSECTYGLEYVNKVLFSAQNCKVSDYIKRSQ